MSPVGDIERITQDRIIALFADKSKLDYEYLSNWHDRLTTVISKKDCLPNIYEKMVTVRH